MGKTILFGEPMALLIADTTGPLENVEHFTRALSGAEVNVSIGLTRLGHSVEYLTRLGDDPFGHYIAKTLGENQIGISLLSYDPVYRTGIQLKNRVTDGSDPYAPYYRKGSAASHISEKEIDAIDLTDVNLVHITGIPPALSQSARKATFRLMQRAKDTASARICTIEDPWGYGSSCESWIQSFLVVYSRWSDPWNESDIIECWNFIIFISGDLSISNTSGGI